MMAPRPRAGRRAGFTMIELLITVALSTLVGVLIYTVFIEQTKAYRLQADMGNMQQNLRVALEMVVRDVSSAGSGAGWNGSSWGVGGEEGNEDAGMYGLRIRDNFPLGGGSDAVEVSMQDPDRSTWVFTAADVSESCDTTVLTLDTDDAGRADTFSTDGPHTKIMCWAPSGMGGGPVSFVWDVDGTGDTSDGTIPVTPNTQTDFNGQCSNSLPAHMACGPVIWVAYYIDRDSADGIGIGSASLPVLYLVPDVDAAMADPAGYPHDDDIPVALGIEDLQVSYCQAGLGTDCDAPANWSAGFSMDTEADASAPAWESISSVRVAITARTLRPDMEFTTVSQPMDIDSTDTWAPTSGLDSYHRRVARTEITLRNATGTWQLMNQPF